MTIEMFGGAIELYAHGDRPISVGVVVPFYVPAFRAGGPIRSIVSMVAAHGDTHEFRIVTSNSDLGVDDPLDVACDEWVTVGAADVRYFDHKSMWHFWRALRALTERRIDYLYVNGFFSIKFSLIPLILWRARILKAKRIVVAPRGEFGAGALALKSSRKTLYIRTVRALRIHEPVIWHASSPAERLEILSLFSRAKVVVRENEAELPEVSSSLEPSCQETCSTPLLRAVYVGRLSPKKGLHLLLGALQMVSGDVELDIFGPHEDERYLRGLRSAAESMPPNISIRFRGPVSHDRVVEIFGGYDAFLFPTLHENFGHVIAESLAAACPVIVCPVTAFNEVIAGGGGVVVSDHETATWTEVIDQLAGLPESEKRTLRLNAGKAYENWRRSSTGPSVFEIVGPVTAY